MRNSGTSQTPTPEQDDVLDSHARIRVVKASPGSGKTWLVAEIVRRELTGWESRAQGIAALSFTRVAGQEIREAVGYDLSHPHFVGTLDAFLLRHVILPFTSKVFPSLRRPRLIPADWNPAHWTKRPDESSWEHLGTGGASARRYNLFNVCYVGESGGEPVLKYREPHQGRLVEIDTRDIKGLRAAKKESWKKQGWLSHSDASLLSYHVLCNRQHGERIRNEIVRRFPLLIIDELQDTGYFLGKSLLTLLAHHEVRGVLVGDPDQAIYEFSGARPDLFSRFQDIPQAAQFPLAHSRRCPAAVAVAARHLKQTGGSFDPAPAGHGRVFLVRYSDMKAGVDTIVRTLAAHRPGATIKVVARRKTTIARLIGSTAKVAGKLGCTELNHLVRAVSLFRQGQQSGALAAARACIDRAVFGHEGLPDSALLDKGIDPRTWKALAIRVLLGCDSIGVDGALHDWQVRAGSLVDAQISTFNLGSVATYKAGRLKPQKRPGWDATIRDCLPSRPLSPAAALDVPVQTVHKVKGETHDATVLVCPEPGRGLPCPSKVWWSTTEDDLEEKRIAYVAMTRSRGDLIVCVSGRTMEALGASQQSFVSCFEVCKAEDFAAVYERGQARGTSPASS